MLHLISFAFKRRHVQPVGIKVHNQQVNTVTFILRSLWSWPANGLLSVAQLMHMCTTWHKREAAFFSLLFLMLWLDHLDHPIKQKKIKLDVKMSSYWLLQPRFVLTFVIYVDWWRDCSQHDMTITLSSVLIKSKLAKFLFANAVEKKKDFLLPQKRPNSKRQDSPNLSRTHCFICFIMLHVLISKSTLLFCLCWSGRSFTSLFVFFILFCTSVLC